MIPKQRISHDNIEWKNGISKEETLGLPVS